MRTELQRFVTLRREYTAIVDTNINKNKSINNNCSKVCCIVEVKTNNRVVSDHCWISVDNLSKNVFKKGNKIKFMATVKPYYKNYRGKKVLDYCLSDIHNVELIEKGCVVVE